MRRYVMPKLILARMPADETKERTAHKLAGSRHAPPARPSPVRPLRSVMPINYSKESLGNNQPKTKIRSFHLFTQPLGSYISDPRNLAPTSQGTHKDQLIQDTQSNGSWCSLCLCDNDATNENVRTSSSPRAPRRGMACVWRLTVSAASRP